uniref:Uncharacterized protein n=1 Tax=Avena sativa TaxID=4498 RepID=A0ACD5XR78_AVESA
MRALIYHAEVRAYDPVGGCYRLVELHDRQLFILQAELEALNQHLDACRGQIRQTEQPLLDDGSGSSGMMMLVGAGPHASDMPGEDALYAAAAAHEIDYGQPSSADHYLLAAAAEDQAPHQLYDYAYSYYDGAAGDETSSHAWTNNMMQQHYGNNNGIIVKDDGSPVASLGDDLIETTQFVDVFDVKPDIAGAATAVGMEHDAGSDDSFDHHQLEEKMVATVVKHELLDHQHQAASQMAAESSAAVSRCQLELGFSSF